jgi:hypothetical protein
VADPVEDGLLREIDEEIRQENFAKLWKQYGTLLIGGAIVLVAAVAGYKAWQGYDLRERTAQGIELATAIKHADDDNASRALEILGKLETNSVAGYTLLSQFQGAGLLAAKGDDQAAAVVYDRIAADSSTGTLYSDLAVILGAIQRMNMKGADLGAITARLAALAADDNPWRYSARELMAVLAEQSGDRATARELLTALSVDANAPRGISSRAAEMLAALAE